jgi:hypothetical protein
VTLDDAHGHSGGVAGARWFFGVEYPQEAVRGVALSPKTTRAGSAALPEAPESIKLGRF